MQKLGLFFAGSFLALSLANAQSIHVVNAASFLQNQSFTPGTIVSIFGSGLATGTAQAGDPEHLPTTLGGATVKIGNTALALFYASPSQVNALIDASIAPGSYQLTIISPAGTFSAPIIIGPTAPGVFSSTGTGTRDGAILNAITFSTGPFTVTTNGAPTYLAIYATGLSLAQPPTVTIGGVSVTVTFYGNAPCCSGLQQINVELPASLAGAGRVEVAVTSGGMTSNIVEVVILPNPGEGDFPPAGENEARARELAYIAYVPGTSTALVTDEEDDVVRVVDIHAKTVTAVIGLPPGSEPTAIAVNAAGTLAVVTERDTGNVAIIDLMQNLVMAQIPTGGGPSAVAIANNLAVVANQDSDTVSIIDLQSLAVRATIGVGRGPRGVAVDPAANRAYVTNQNAGTISVIDLAGLSVVNTIDLGSNSRPAAIQVMPALGIALVSEPCGHPGSSLLIVDLVTGAITPTNIRLAGGGGIGAIAVAGNTAFLANQTGGSVTVATISVSNGQVTLTPLTVKVDLGPRALAVDTVDNLLLVTNQGSGNIVLIDLATNQVVGRIHAVKSKNEDDGDENGHGDRDHAANLPTVISVSPAVIQPGSTVTVTVTGTILQGATGLAFVDPSTLPGKGKGRGNGHSGNHSNGPFASFDPNFTVSSVAVNSAGTQLTAVVTLSAASGSGNRVVRVLTPNGASSFVASSGNTITIP